MKLHLEMGNNLNNENECLGNAGEMGVVAIAPLKFQNPPNC